MNNMRFRNAAVIYAAVATLLAACGGSQQIGAPGAMPQSRAFATHAQHGGSWMLPEAKGEDLLYASNQNDVDEGVYVFSYPKGKLVGELTGFSYNAPAGLCSDSKGNIFVTSGWLSSSGQFHGQIDEYAHGGVSPIETLSDPAAANGCAIDPTTGNLAVTNWAGQAGSFDHGDVAIYANAQGTPTIYYTSTIYWYWYCAYDDNGNLFVDGYAEGGPYPLAELPAGSSSFLNVTLDQESFSPGSLQWVNGDLLIAGGTSNKLPIELYTAQISGTTGTIVETTTLKSKRHAAPLYAQFWTQGGNVIGPSHSHNRLEFWKYPAGGHPMRAIKGQPSAEFIGVAISLGSKSLKTLTTNKKRPRRTKPA
jgi:hypothetical protein